MKALLCIDMYRRTHTRLASVCMQVHKFSTGWCHWHKKRFFSLSTSSALNVLLRWNFRIRGGTPTHRTERQCWLKSALGGSFNKYKCSQSCLVRTVFYCTHPALFGLAPHSLNCVVWRQKGHYLHDNPFTRCQVVKHIISSTSAFSVMHFIRAPYRRHTRP